MLRRFRIKTRLLISFAILVFFTLIIGLTGFAGLTSIGKMAVTTIHNVRILNDIYDYCAAVDTGISSMLYIADTTLNQHIIQTTREHTKEMMEEMDRYLEIQEQFIDIFSPGEMQDIATIFEVYRDTYIPLANEIFSLVSEGRTTEALSVSVNRLSPIYNTIIYTINSFFLKNLNHSEIVADRSNKLARNSAVVMLIFVLLSLGASIGLALGVTRSIAVPLSDLEISAKRIVDGDLTADIQVPIDGSCNDEITYLSLRLQDSLKHIRQAQQLKLEAMNAQLEKEKAQAAALSKSKFLAKMSHEIRTPMNAITGMAELALREDMPAAAREHIATIKQASANLLSIINDILDFSKIDSGKLEIVSAEYLVSSLINDVINIIRMRVIDSHIRFIVNIDSNIPNSLFGDEIRIRQIFLNLLSNAFKYTEKGFVSLFINGDISEDNFNFKIEVSDTGRGIKEEDIDKLFSDFVQVDLIGNKGIEGTGLGLAITQGLVKAMNGTISVSSEYGKGSTFTVTLPQKICGEEKLASVNGADKKNVLVYEPRQIYADSIIHTIENLGVKCKLASGEEELNEEITKNKYSFIFIASKIYEKNKEQWSKIKAKTKIVLLTGYYDVIADQNLNILPMPAHTISIANILNGIAAGALRGDNNKVAAKFIAPAANILVVDDINTNLKVVEGLLLPYKMSVDMCQSGLEAIDAVKEKKYDIVFMDHMMPDMDGIETTMRIRGWEWDKRKEGIKNTIIALTANAVSGMREMFLGKGFDDFLAKPIDISKLDEILDRWIPQEKKEFGKIDEAFTAHDPGLAFPAIPGVDTAKGLAMTGGTEAGYRLVLATFSKDAEDRLPFLRNIPTPETISAFVTQVHALKSAAGSIGAAELSAQAAKLEAAGKAGDMDFIQNELDLFTDNLTKLAKNIHTAIETDKKESKKTKSKEGAGLKKTDIKKISPLLRKLVKALKEQNLSEIDRIMGEFDRNKLDKKTCQALDKISDDLLMTEFDEALKKAEEILHDKA
jgi:signal transduction histidine kinase/CheY-like chemotaxis protein